MIKIFVVEDHKLIVDGLALQFEYEADFELVGFALNGESALEQIPQLDIDLIILDVHLPDITGVEVCKAIIKSNPDAKIMALSMLQDLAMVKRMLQAGAKGYVVKNAGKDEVSLAIRTIYEDNKFISKEINEALMNDLYGQKSNHQDSTHPKLSRREKEVMSLILSEMTSQEIAKHLFISLNTVESHRKNMLSKLGVRNTVGLVKTVLNYGLLND